MHTLLRPRSLAGLLLLFGVAVAGCGVSNSTSGTGTATAPVAGATPIVKVASASVKGTTRSILTDTNGMSLYHFDSDTSTTSACTGSCSQNWPALLLASGTPGGVSSLPGQLTTLTDPNGRQVLYNGHPLYHFSGDQKPGDVNGDGISGLWHVATPDLMPAAAPTSGPTATPNPYNY